MRVGSMMHPLMSYSDADQDHDDGDLLDDDGQLESHTNLGMHHGMDGSKAEIRKSNKPIMEKRRRARINNCLNDLKGILLEAMRKDPARHSKLEKADILELTVRHLQNVQRNQLAVAMATDPTVLHRFKNGFSECATEVGRYIGRLEGSDPGIRHRLTNHLNACVNGLQQVGPMAFGASARYAPLGVGIPFGPPSPVGPPPPQPTLPVPQTAVPIIQIPPHVQSVGDVNNNGPNGRFVNASATITSSNVNPMSGVHVHHLNRNHPSQQHQQIPPLSSSAFSTVSRRVHTPPSSPSLSSLSSDTPNNVSMCSGSDSSSLSLSSEKVTASPIDFSIKVKGSSRPCKMEPMNMSTDSSSPTGRDSMWRPW